MRACLRAVDERLFPQRNWTTSRRPSTGVRRTDPTVTFTDQQTKTLDQTQGAGQAAPQPSSAVRAEIPQRTTRLSGLPFFGGLRVLPFAVAPLEEPGLFDNMTGEVIHVGGPGVQVRTWKWRSSVSDREIFVRLVDEPVDVWRPVRAEHVEYDRYRILEPPYDRDAE